MNKLPERVKNKSSLESRHCVYIPLIKSKVTSILLASVLIGSIFQYFPEGSALIETDPLPLNNVLPTDFIFRTDSNLLDLSVAEINYNPNAVRVMIRGSGNINDIPNVHVSHHLKTSDGFVAFGATTADNLPLLRTQGFEVVRDVRLEFDQVRDASRLGDILGTEAVSRDYGFTGKGIKIAVVDTGTDFSNRDLMHAVARDVNKRPIMLDADGQGIVLTKTVFKANITPAGNLLNSTLPKDAEPNVGNVYINDKGEVYLNLNRGGNGTQFDVYNSLYPFVSPLILNATSKQDWKIGESNRDFIRSKSGEYRMGFALQVQFHLGRAGLIIIPVLLVDSDKAGLYDTIIPDMSSSWADFARFELRKPANEIEFDFSFVDERQIKLGNNNEFLIYDADKDGNIDLTGGMVGAHVLDIWGALNDNGKARVDRFLGAVNGTLLKPIDPNGEYFGVMFDFLGHGTGSAASIASRGHDLYDVYNNSTKYRLKGVAPDAKIIPVKALWYGDVVYGWLWASGFDQDEEGNWQYTGSHKADVINNSWGVSKWPVLQHGPGYDILSILSSLLSVPGTIDEKFPGVLMVHSAGNTGYGYGTLGPPSSASFALTVGATTNNVFVGYDFTKDQPRFGNSTAFYDDVVGFSSRGPSMIGEVKPEVMSIGAYGFVPLPPNTKHIVNATGPFGLFGGTSMSAPLAAGMASLVMEALNNESMEINPFIVRSILMSTATDMNSDPFTQGSGKADALNAINYVKGKEGMFLVYTDDTYSNIANLLNQTLSNYEIRGLGNNTIALPDTNQTITIPEGNYTLSLPDKSFPDSKWYAGYIDSGESREADFTIVNRSNSSLTVEIKPTMLEMIKQQSINGTTEVRKKDPALDEDGRYAPNYIDLSSKMEIPEGTELMVIKAHFPFESFLNSTEPIYADALSIASLYFYDWKDKNEDGEVSFNELSMVNRGGAWGTVQELTIRDPLNRVKNTPLIGIYPVPTIFSYWSGNTNKNSTSMNYTLTVSFYKKGEWDMLSVNMPTLELAPDSQRVFKARIDVPEDAMPGIYQGFLTVKSEKHTTNIPVSFAVPMQVHSKDIPIVISGTPREDLLYDNTSVMGSFDMLSRYNAGDWRYYPFNVTDPTVNAISMKITWKNNWTSINAMVTDPTGKIVASSVPAGVFEVFLGWASNDWLGTTRFSQGGGFYPAANHGTNSTVFYVPVNSTGIHTLMLHTTLFHGEELIELVLIEAKFTTLLPDTEPPLVKVELEDYVRGVVEIPVAVVDENLEGVVYSINGSEPVSIEDGTIILDTMNMMEGFHRLTITAWDVVGHRVYKDLVFAVDNTPPLVTIRSPAEGEVVPDKFDISLEVFDSTLKVFTVTLPDGTVVENTMNIEVDTKELDDGDYNIVIRAEDGAGNVTEKTIPIRVDNTPPLVAISSPIDGAEIAGVSNVRYSVEEENLKSVVLTVAGKSIEIGDSGTYALDTTTLFDANYVLEITAEDMAGNVGSAFVNVATTNFGPTLLNAQLIGLMIGLAIGAGVATAVVLAKYRKKSALTQQQSEDL